LLEQRFFAAQQAQHRRKSRSFRRIHVKMLTAKIAGLRRTIRRFPQQMRAQN